MAIGFVDETVLAKIKDWMKGLREQKEKGEEWLPTDKKLLSQIMFLGVPTDTIKDNFIQTSLLIEAGIRDAETVFVFNELSAELDRRVFPEG